MKKIKLIFFLIIVVSGLISTLTVRAVGTDKPKLYIDNKSVSVDADEHSMISVREMAEYLGYTVERYSSDYYTVYDKEEKICWCEIRREHYIMNHHFSSVAKVYKNNKTNNEFYEFKKDPVYYDNNPYVYCEDIAYMFGMKCESYPEIGVESFISARYEQKVEYEVLYNNVGESITINSMFLDQYLKLGYKRNISDVDRMTVYAADGRSKEIYSGSYKEERQVGWYSTPPIVIYSPYGNQKMISEDELNLYENDQWYREPVQMLYAEGKSEIVLKKDVPAQLSVGWYEEPVVRLYAEGKSEIFKEKEVMAQLSVGWYREPVVRLYAEGKSALFPQREAAAQLSVGWYDEPVERVISMDGRTQLIVASEMQAWKNVGWINLKEVAASYNFNDSDEILRFLNRYFSRITTSTGVYDLKHNISKLSGVYYIRIEYPYAMCANMNNINDYTMNECVDTKYQVKDMMYAFASVIMNKSSLPIEMCFYDWGYEYPSLRVGFNSSNLCTCLNYKEKLVTAWDGTTFLDKELIGFKWAFEKDDYYIYRK